MAKIHEEIIIIKVSKLIKDSEADAPTPMIANNELVSSLGAVAEELAGAGVIVEVERA